MLELTLSAKSDYLGIINVNLFSEHLTSDYLEDYFKRRAKQGIHSKLIWPELSTFAKRVLARSVELKIQVRYLPTHVDWRSGFVSWNESLSLMSFVSGQVTCTIIENTDIVSFHRDVIFCGLWNQAARS